MTGPRSRDSGEPPADGFPARLSSPARRALAAAGFHKLEQLAEVRAGELARLHGVGPKAIDQLRSALSACGLWFADETAGKGHGDQQ